MLLYRLRSLVPACLMLGALLCTVPTLADAPAAPAAAARKIVLQNVVPSDIFTKMHWNQLSDLPAGVTQILPLPGDNALSVIATPAGFASVQQIVKILDIAPSQVQIKIALAEATQDGLKASGINFDFVPLSDPQPGAAAKPVFVMYANGSLAARFLQTLTKQGGVTQAPVVSTSNNVTASIRLSTSTHSQEVASQTVVVTPRINSDNSVTLALHLVFSDGPVTREINTFRTFNNGQTSVIVMPPADPHADGRSLLLFVTSTLE